MDRLTELIANHELLRLKGYRDAVGKWTVGWGHNIEDRPISRRAADIILEDDIDGTKAELLVYLPWYAGLDEVRRAVIVDMAFNMGVGGLMSFKKALTALRAHQYNTAAEEMLDSKWSQQVGARAQRLALVMRQG